MYILIYLSHNRLIDGDTMKNKKAFSMIELLATVVILGIVISIGVLGISSVLSNSHNKYNNSQKNLVQSAAEDYFANNKKDLPTIYMETKTIKLGELINGKYIGEIRDAGGHVCDKNESYVIVTRIGSNKYKYNTVLKCGNNIIGEHENNNHSDLLVNATWDYSEYSKVFDGNTMLNSQERETKPNIRYYTNNKIVVKVNLSGEEITGYKYVVNRLLNNGEKKYKESEVKEINASIYQDTIVLDKKHFKDGVYQIQIIAYNGKTKYNDNLKSNKIVIDTKKPRCSISVAGTTGDNGWYKSRIIDLTLSITEVNIHKYSFERNEAINSNDLVKPAINYVETTNLTFERQQDNTTGVKWYGDIEDRAGNQGSCTSIHFKLDKDKPECNVLINRNKVSSDEESLSIHPDGRDHNGYDTGWYVTNVNLDLKEWDIGPSNNWQRDMTTSTSPTYRTDKNTMSNIQREIKQVVWHGYVKDYAGNVNHCNTPEFKVDTTKPTCRAEPYGTKGENDWFISYHPTMNTGPADATSLIRFKGLSTSSSPDYNGTTSYTQGETKGIRWYCYVEDHAGNTNYDSYYVKVDTIPPGVSYFTVEGSTSNRVYGFNDKDPNLSFYAQDTNPLKYQYSVGSSASSGANSPVLYNNMSYSFGCSINDSYCSGWRYNQYQVTPYYYVLWPQYLTVYVTVKDEAGNTVSPYQNYTVYGDCSKSHSYSYTRQYRSSCDARCDDGVIDIEDWGYWNDDWTGTSCSEMYDSDTEECHDYPRRDSSPFYTDDDSECSESCGNGTKTVTDYFYTRSMYDNRICDIEDEERDVSCKIKDCEEEEEPETVSLGCPSKPSMSTDSSSSTKWKNKNIKLTLGSIPSSVSSYTWKVKVGSGSYSSEGSNTKSITLSDEGKLTVQLKIKDSKGNSKTCSMGTYYIDKTKPHFSTFDGIDNASIPTPKFEWIENDYGSKGACNVEYYSKHGAKMKASDYKSGVSDVSGIHHWEAKVTFSNNDGSCNKCNHGSTTKAWSKCGGECCSSLGTGTCKRCYRLVDKAGNKSDYKCTCQSSSNKITECSS